MFGRPGTFYQEVRLIHHMNLLIWNLDRYAYTF